MASSSQSEIQPYMFEPELNSDEADSDNGADSSDSDTDIPDHMRGRIQQYVRDWCTCMQCILMPKDRECMCCQEWSEILDRKIDGLTCICEHEQFSLVCLEPVVLCMAYIQFMSYKKIPGRAPDTLTNRQSRLMAYRQFCLWAHQGFRLGKNNRKVLPSCVVAAIRKSFPEDSGDYTGFMDAQEVRNALDSDSE